jgi:signal transduction histidine kinase/ActR/RegA family two-component response regulator
MPRDVPRRLTLLPLVAVAVILLAAVAAVVLGKAQAQTNGWIMHTLETEMAIAELRADARRIDAAHRGFLIANDARYIAEFDATVTATWREFAVVGRLVADNPEQRRTLAALRPKLVRKIMFARASTRMQADDPDARDVALAALDRGRLLTAAIERDLATMRTREDALLARRIEISQWIIRLLGIGLAATVLLTVVVALLGLREGRRRERSLALAREDAEDALERLRGEMTARGEAEDRVRQMQKIETLGQLTGGIAHDFNNMLAVVIGSLDMVERRGDDPERRARYLAGARDGAERAAALTARLLAFSRQQPLAPVAIDANRMVGGMSELLRRTLGEQIRIETALAGGLWSTFADVGQLENAILNLAVNARDAMMETPARGGRLTIETANAQLDGADLADQADVAPGQYVLLCVSDTGMGMPPEVIARAFDPFFTTKGVGKGTGLGLSQVFGFVKQSGGHVTIASEPGHGTTVKLYMPRATGPATETSASAETGSIPQGSPDEIVLVVEDETRVRHFSVDALRDLGYTALSAASPAEALGVIAQQPSIALLFTDVVMPEMDGRQLADRAHALRPDLKVLYTTGYTPDQAAYRGVSVSEVSVLAKPFTVAQLAIKVRQVLDNAGS